MIRSLKTHATGCSFSELRAGIIEEDDLNQIIRDQNSLSRKLADGDSKMIESILIGSEFDDKVIINCKREKSIDEKTLRLINCKVTPKMDGLDLKEANI